MCEERGKRREPASQRRERKQRGGGEGCGDNVEEEKDQGAKGRLRDILLVDHWIPYHPSARKQHTKRTIWLLLCSLVLQFLFSKSCFHLGHGSILTLEFPKPKAISWFTASHIIIPLDCIHNFFPHASLFQHCLFCAHCDITASKHKGCPACTLWVRGCGCSYSLTILNPCLHVALMCEPDRILWNAVVCDNWIWIACNARSNLQLKGHPRSPQGIKKAARINIVILRMGGIHATQKLLLMNSLSLMEHL